MKFPWKKREEELHKETLKAEGELEDIKKRWPQVVSATSVTRQHRQMNHWSAEIQAIFTGRH